jgi:hypothetical protein
MFAHITTVSRTSDSWPPTASPPGADRPSGGPAPGSVRRTP